MDAPRVFCFSHAGGSAIEFQRWRADGLAFVGLGLRGRGMRFHEPADTDLVSIVKHAAEDIADEIQDGRPYGFFGHSFGALVAFEMTRHLRRHQLPMPQWLWLSGFPSPDRFRAEDELPQLSDEALLRTLADRFGAIPDEVFADPEYISVVASYVRADYLALEGYIYEADDPLDCTAEVFVGYDDPIDRDAVLAWRRHFQSGCETREFPGGHFYLYDGDNSQLLPQLIAAAISRSRKERVS